MAKHDQTRDGGMPGDQVDPSKIVKPREDNDGRHSGGTGTGGSSSEPDNEEK